MKKFINNYNLIETTTSMTNITYLKSKFSHSEQELSISWHDEVEIIYILEGEGEFIIDGKEYKVRANSFILLNPNQLHSAKAIIGRPITFESIKFNYEMLLSVFPDSTSSDYILPLIENTRYLPNTILPIMPLHKEALSLFQMMADLWKDQSSMKYILVKSYLLHLIYILYKNRYVYRKNKSTLERQGTEIVRETIQYIHEHYSEDFNLDFMCVNLETSKPNLCRVFKRHTKKTITEFLNEYRIQIACDYLIHSTLDISDIAYKIGYNHLSYFNTRFKKNTLLTPQQFRTAYKK